jgi:hypothetical protein
MKKPLTDLAALQYAYLRIWRSPRSSFFYILLFSLLVQDKCTGGVSLELKKLNEVFLIGFGCL